MTHHPVLSFVLQNLFLLCFVVAILVLFVLLMYLLQRFVCMFLDELSYVVLAPNALVSLGLMDIIVQPLRVQLATTNTAIVQQAYLTFIP